jgi:hypothetical protein
VPPAIFSTTTRTRAHVGGRSASRGARQGRRSRNGGSRCQRSSHLLPLWKGWFTSTGGARKRRNVGSARTKLRISLSKTATLATATSRTSINLSMRAVALSHRMARLLRLLRDAFGRPISSSMLCNMLCTWLACKPAGRQIFVDFLGERPLLGVIWRAQRDSNPCFRRERVDVGRSASIAGPQTVSMPLRTVRPCPRQSAPSAGRK